MGLDTSVKTYEKIVRHKEQQEPFSLLRDQEIVIPQRPKIYQPVKSIFSDKDDSS